MRPIPTVRMSEADLLRVAVRFGLAAHQMRTAAYKAVNDVATTGRNQTRRRIRAHVTLPADRVKQAVHIISRATPERLEAVIALDHKARGQDRRPTLMSFAGRPKTPHGSRTPTGRVRKRMPFTHQILKRGPRTTHPTAFVAVSRGRSGRDQSVKGNIQAFARKGDDRYPLVVPRGPSVAALWQNPENRIEADVLKNLNERLPERIQGQARRIYDGKWKRIAA